MRLRRSNVWVALSLAAGPPSGQETIHQNPEFCYTIEVPGKWSAESGELSSGTRAVWLTWLSNTPMAIAVVPTTIPVENSPILWTRPTLSGTYRGEAGWEAAERILAPGTVSICIGVVWGLPPTLEPYARDVSDYPESRIREFLKAPCPKYESERITSFEVWAERWGEQWSIGLYGRKPYKEEDLQDGLVALGTLAFPSVPITSKFQAVELVIQQIPRYAMHDFSGMECFLGQDYEQWNVLEEVDGFRITYAQLNGTEERTPLRSYRYFISRDAQVSLLAQRVGKLFPESTVKSRSR